MRLTEFWRRMDVTFGPTYSRSYARDQSLAALGSRTVEQALADGDEAKSVWRAVVASATVPPHER